MSKAKATATATVTRLRAHRPRTRSTLTLTNILSAAFLVLVGVGHGRSFTVRPEDESGLDWIVTSGEWEFTIGMSGGDPVEVKALTIIGGDEIIFDLSKDRRRPLDMDESWIHIFTNVVRMTTVERAIVLSCRVHPEWPYTEEDTGGKVI